MQPSDISLGKTEISSEMISSVLHEKEIYKENISNRELKTILKINAEKFFLHNLDLKLAKERFKYGQK